MLSDRIDLYKQIETERNSKLLVYITSTRAGLETQIANDVLPKFTEHLDKIGDTEKITLYLYTNGGDTLTAWSLVNLIRSFCKNFEVIIPANCFSSGTLICLGSDNLVMTKQATLGPIDPSVNGPFNPMIPGVNDPNMKLPVSVEFVNAYVEMARETFGIKNSRSMKDVLLSLSEKIHPMTLGQVYRTHSQIQMLARKLMKWHKLSPEQEDEIIKFLCSESGSHDYSIHRNEAVEHLGLHVEKPTMDFYKVIKSIYDDISSELEFENPYNPSILLNKHNPCQYSFRRGLIESLYNGTDVFISEGNLSVTQVGGGMGPMGPIPVQNKIENNRIFEGWRHE